MVDQAIRDEVGVRRGRQRHLSEDPTPLHDVSDPHAWEDETKTSIRDIVSDNPWPALIATMFGVVVLIALYFIAGNFAYSVATNTWVHRIAIVMLIAGGMYVLGRSAQQDEIVETDWLVLKTPNGILEYPGELQTGVDGSHPVFQVHKGFTRLGNLSSPYKVHEFSPELARSLRTTDDEDEPVARIRLHPTFAGVDTTSRGRVVCQLAAGLDVDRNGRDTQLYAEMPDTADESRLDELAEKLRESQARVNDLQSQSDTLREQRDNYKELASETYDGAVEDFVSQVERLESSRRVSRTSPGADSSDGQAGSPGDFDAIEAELQDD